MDRSSQFYGTQHYKWTNMEMAPPAAAAAAAMEMESSSSSSVAAASAFCTAAAQSESNYMVDFHQQHNNHIDQIDDQDQNHDDDHIFCSELLEEYHDLQIPFCQSSGKLAAAVNSLHHHQNQSNYEYYCLYGSCEKYFHKYSSSKNLPIKRSAQLSSTSYYKQGKFFDNDDEEAVLDPQVQRHELISCSSDHQLPESKVCSKSNNNDGDVVSASSNSKAASRSKQRIRWTQDLHERFVECVNYLGGAEKATPRAILKLMDSNLLTILHVKSHLQKYRTSKYISEYTQGKSEKSTITNDTLELDMKTGLIQIKEAMQQVNMHLHDQLETQHKLHLLLEEQGRQLKMIFDKQQDSQA